MHSLRRRSFLPAVLLVPIGLVAVTGCATAADDHDTAHPAWSYGGAGAPEHWGSITDEYERCGTGTRQSPVDLPSPRRAGPLDLRLPDGPVTGTTADNGHTVQFTVDDAPVTVVAGAPHRLLQVHHHAGSEHTVGGERAAAEFHFVHADAAGDLLVLGVLAEVGAHNPAYEDHVAGATAGTGRETSVDLAAMLPAERSFATYEGSLTTPPCTEGVRWVVFDDPVELGRDQLDELLAAHADNARPVQELGDRRVEHELSLG